MLDNSHKYYGYDIFIAVKIVGEQKTFFLLCVIVLELGQKSWTLEKHLQQNTHFNRENSAIG